MNKDIIIEKDDVIPYIYFVCSMAQRGKMYGGLSGKSDYIGGIFDRWINIIPESVIFNKYFLPQISNKLTVISDYYEYDPKKSGIAPDVLGVKYKDKTIPFVQYENKWLAIEGAPQIEVKSFKKSQYMVSLRNQGYNNKFLVMTETNLDSDYLLPFFEENVISDDTYRKLRMEDKVFIKENDHLGISPVTKITRTNSSLGTLKLITVCSAQDFMDYANLCGPTESPFYVKEIRETRTSKNLDSQNPRSFTDVFQKTKSGFCKNLINILDGNSKHKILDLYASNIEDIKIIKHSKSSMTVYSSKDAKINQFNILGGKTYIIKFQLLDRSSNHGEEYFMNKAVIGNIPSREEELIKNIKNFIDK